MTWTGVLGGVLYVVLVAVGVYLACRVSYHHGFRDALAWSMTKSRQIVAEQGDALLKDVFDSGFEAGIEHAYIEEMKKGQNDA
jgi:hypothetical protein